jgi:uncharacterized DUF497 family protein
MPDDVIYKGRFIWNRRKNELNKQKHHISFERASQVFDDPFYHEEFDEENSIDEERFNVTGSVTGLINNNLITVSVMYRGDFIRIFSARDANPIEEKDYNEQFGLYFGGIDGNRQANR